MYRMKLKAGLRGLVLAAGTAIAATGAFAAPEIPAGYALDGYQTIFDGSAASFANWTYVGSGSSGFSLKPDGTMQTIAGRSGAIWYNVEKLGDFSVKLEFRDDSPTSRRGNSGVLLRSPDLNSGFFGCQGKTACGYEVQINDGNTADPRLTGSIYGFDDIYSATAAGATAKGVWSTMEILVIGQHYQVWRNGELINDYLSVPGVAFPGRPTDPGSSGRGLVGWFGLQSHGSAEDVVSFRNVQFSSVSAVPEPETYMMMAAGLAFVFGVAKRRRRAG